MKNKLINVYGLGAFLVLVIAVVWFTLSVSSETHRGSIEAERSFSWISKEAVAASVSDGFMTDSFVRKLTDMCRQSRLLSALVVSTPSGTVFAWPEQSSSIKYDMSGKPVITNTSLFMKVYSSNLDIGDGNNGSVVITAVMYVLHPDTIFAASRNSFLVILALLFTTLIIIIASAPGKKKTVLHTSSEKKSANTFEDFTNDSAVDISAAMDETEKLSQDTFVAEKTEDSADSEIGTASGADEAVTEWQNEVISGSETATDSFTEKSDENKIDVEYPEISGVDVTKPEGLFSPVTGIGWESYLSDRLEAELVRAASSEQDLSLVIIRVSGLLHTDLLSRKIAQVLLDTFKFKDMVFEFGSNGFAGILQNLNLDQAMKIADTLYAGIDSLLMSMSYEGQITVGITTRTARLLPAARMIEEAESAAKKAEEEPNLPIVAFRANPEKYRNFVAENN